jgi:hypothetical protein
MNELQKQVSVIIVSYNTKDLTKKCISSVFEKTENIDFEIIVIDNASKDGSVEELNKIFQDKITIIVSKENLGFGKANNLGIKKATGKYVFLLNSDTELINNAIKIFYDYMEQNEKVGICGGNLYDENMQPTFSCNNTISSFFSYFFHKYIYPLTKIYCLVTKKHIYPYFNYTDKIKNVGDIIGADMFIRKELLDKHGGFDENIFLYREDTELNYRIYNNGYSIVSVPQAKIFHFCGKSGSKDIINKHFQIIKSETYVYYKLYGKKSYFIYLNRKLAWLLRIIIYIIIPDFILDKMHLPIYSIKDCIRIINFSKEEFIKIRKQHKF